MASEGADFEASATPPVGVIAGASREDVQRRRSGEREGASIVIGLVAIAIAALSAVLVWLGS
jgi:hypothetical protein